MKTAWVATGIEATAMANIVYVFIVDAVACGTPQ